MDEASSLVKGQALTRSVRLGFSAGVQSPDLEPTLRGPAPGQRVFGRYILDGIVGRGGMGVVWRARDETLGETVALKFLPDAVRWDPGAFVDLKAETRRARQLTHPNIIRVHDFVEDANGAAIAMEFVDGRTLTAVRLENGHRMLEPSDIVPWLPQLCAALDYAHQQAKVVHRDLKPSNILLTGDGVVKVGDFGIARSLADSITRVSMMSAGTLVYMSPQQAMGEEPTPADDVYSLGATLYELLAGKPPFHTGDVRVQLFQRKPDSIAARRKAVAREGREGGEGRGKGTRGGAEAGIPRAWEETIAVCLAKEAAERPASAGEVAARLNGAKGEAGSPSFAKPTAGRPSRPGWARDAGIVRRLTSKLRLARRVSPTLAAIVLGVVALAAWHWWPRTASNSPATWPSDATRALAAWNFDGDGRDGSGRDFHAANEGSTVPTTDRFGRIDRALHFNGNADLVVADAAALRWDGAQPFSIAVWAMPIPGPSQNRGIVAMIPAGVGENHWALVLDGDKPRIRLGRWNEDRAVTVAADQSVREREWVHLAATSDGLMLRLFIGGRLAAEKRIIDNAIGPRPSAMQIRFGSLETHARWNFVGELDEARLWARTVEPDEIAALAAREAHPLFRPTRGVYSDKSDLAAAVMEEFGASARLADWNELARWHADDPRVWADESEVSTAGGDVFIQRDGQRLSEAPRHYFITRFDGRKPDYYSAHAELGGMTLALGSWYGMSIRALARLPAASPRAKTLTSENGQPPRHLFGDAAPRALAISWEQKLALQTRARAHVELKLRNGRVLMATCALSSDARIALALGSSHAPERTRQMHASHEPLIFTLVVRDFLLRFRAVAALGNAPLFQEELRLEDLRCVDLAELSVPGAAAAKLIIE